MAQSKPKHSFAQPGTQDDGRLYAPAVARNADALLEAIQPFLPGSGTVLEIASGTGEHAVKFAAAAPQLTWQPTDIDPERLASIRAWTKATGAANVAEPRAYNAITQAWQGEAVQGVFLANLIHLISKDDTERLLGHMADALSAEGLALIYGPFLRGTAYASEGDERFDASIQAQMPEAGYKDIGWIEQCLREHGLDRVDRIDMPANNLLTVWRRP